MIRQIRNRRKFEKAAAEVSSVETLCATVVDDKPVYFSMPLDATNEEVYRKAFELREGRAMSPTERALLSLAEQTRN
jgi:hypothetical protein